MTLTTQWLTLIVTCAVYLVGGGIFVGVVRSAITSLTKALDKLEQRMDRFDNYSDGSIASNAELTSRVNTLEREMREVRDLRDLVITQGTLQKERDERSNHTLKALEERIAGAVAMIANTARRQGKLPA